MLDRILLLVIYKVSYKHFNYIQNKNKTFVNFSHYLQILVEKN